MISFLRLCKEAYMPFYFVKASILKIEHDGVNQHNKIQLPLHEINQR